MAFAAPTDTLYLDTASIARVGEGVYRAWFRSTCNPQTMAESTQRLSPGIKAASPQVDWTALSGFRNILVHDYLRIDLDRIWTTVEQDVPTLKAVLAPPPS